MVKFFVPPFEAGDPQTEGIYESIREFERQKSGWHIADERIFRISWVRDMQEYQAEVGKLEPYEQALTVAILRSNAYLVCTPDRGVLRGDPILVGLNEVSTVELFEESPGVS